VRQCVGCFRKNAALTSREVTRKRLAPPGVSEHRVCKLYTYDAKIFNPFEQRPESGRVSAARKEREYFENKTTFHPEITSPIDVFLLADNVAVTDVTTLDFEGRMRFVHQHHSDVFRDTAPPAI
jgi:hypothetical protein